MLVVAWVVVGQKQHRSVYLEHERAIEQAVKHHGIVRSLVIADDINLMLAEAYNQGVRAGSQIEKGQADADD